MRSSLFGILILLTTAVPAAELRVMSFNLWHGGDAGKQPLEQTAKVIRAAKADVVGLQEVAGLSPAGTARPDNGEKLAALLGWNYQRQTASTGILSRFPIKAPLGKEKQGAVLTLERGDVALFNVHLAHKPYQPYQLLSIPYVDSPPLKSADEAIESATKTRGGQVRELLAAVEESKAAVQIVTGDFNEPSARDWTAEAVAAKRCPLVVAWPTTKAVEAAGFVDAFRKQHPDPVQTPGITWTPTTKPDDPKDHHDRIDFVFVRGPVKIVAAEVVGEAPERADLVVTPYPSDHRAVVVTLELAH